MGALLRNLCSCHDQPCLRLRAAKLLQDWASDQQLGAGCTSREGSLYRSTTINVHVPRGNDLIERRLSHDREDVGLGETLWPRNGQNVPICCEGQAKRLAEQVSIFSYIRSFRNEHRLPSIEVPKTQSMYAGPVPRDDGRVSNQLNKHGSSLVVLGCS